jgi:hypothetical protein
LGRALSPLSDIKQQGRLLLQLDGIEHSPFDLAKRLTAQTRAAARHIARLRQCTLGMRVDFSATGRSRADPVMSYELTRARDLIWRMRIMLHVWGIKNGT